MRFVWIVADISVWNHNELRYSIRSVKKFHPDSDVCIVGYKPDWYEGDHIQADDDDTRYRNTYRKAYIACGNFKEWVLMHDDFYLLEPFKKVFCYNGYLKDRKTSENSRGLVIRDLQERLPDSLDYNQHTPIPVWSATVLKEMPPTGDGFKQIYCSIETRYDRVVQKDVKIKGRHDPIPKEPFFSTWNNCKHLENQFEKLYPAPSKHEIDMIG